MKIIDLYAGIGGIRLGFERAFKNIECVFTSEINSSSIETYKANFGDKNIHGDIETISVHEIPDFDMLLAGFPCQPFSIAGLRKAFNDPRGQAFFEIIHILKEKKPRLFLLENVPNLLYIENGSIFEIIKYRLQKIGYNIAYQILSANDYGVPQKRKRLYIVGWLDSDKIFEFPEAPKTPVQLGDILEQNVSEKYIVPPEKFVKYKMRHEKDRRSGYARCGVFNSNSPYTVTMVAGYAAHPEKILIAENGYHRILTERESARLQGFPDDFVIVGDSSRAVYQQMGNSVCVPVIEAIARKIKETFGE